MCRILTFWDTKFGFCEGKVWRQSITKSKKWNRIDNNKSNSHGHIQVCLRNKEGKRKMCLLHRIVYKAYHPSWDILDNSTNNCIDHKDGNNLNNHKDNLHVVSNQENQFNRKRARGYSFNKGANKWQARIKLDRINIHIGYYDNETDARQAYLDGKEKYHIIKERSL
tara:strand:- start:431 stop:931 length:501 start_codon:yes stop_codon:yes gene_type:complete